jgi:hypothetical protein
MPTLPWGFSPVESLKQVGDWAGVYGNNSQGANYDTLSQVDTNQPQVQGAYTGAPYYDSNTGQMVNMQMSDPNPNPTTSYFDSNGNRISNPNTPAADPNAAKRATFNANLGGAVGNIKNNAMDAFGSSARNLRGTAESLFNTAKATQGGIDRSRENIEMNRLAGVDDILSFVRNGLKSGGARLANMNAGESSAAGEMGRAFGDEGGNRMRKVGNQAFLQDREIDTQQDTLNNTIGQGKTDFTRGRDDAVATISQQVRQDLADLEAKAQEIGATGPQVEAERQRIIDEGMGQLNEVDTWLQSQIGGVGPQDRATTQKNAVELRRGGQAAATPFDFGQFQVMQGGGPAMSQLPIFTSTKRRDQ